MKEILEKRKKREKHFLKEDGNIVAEVYDYDIHYLKDSKYEEIDNTLLKINNYYENKSNDFKVDFSDNDLSFIYKIQLKNHYMMFNLNNRLESTFKVDSISSLIQNILYENILDNIDIKYNLMSSELKENIILKSKNNQSKITFTIETDLDLVLENNSVYAKDKIDNSTIFVMKIPYMYDANNKINNNVFYELTHFNNYYQLNLLLDNEWLNDNNTLYPVVIDPTVVDFNNQSSVIDTYIYPGDNGVNKGNLDILKVGVENINGQSVTNRTLLKFELPTIGTGGQIISAMVNMINYSGYPSNTNPIAIHKMITDWNEDNATWELLNDKYDNTIEIVESGFYNNNIGDDLESNQSTFNITNLVKNWYSNMNNYGLMLKYLDETNTNNISSYYSRESTIRKPILLVEYRDQTGSEDYTKFSTQSLSYGSLNVNNCNGNLMGFFPITSTIGGNMTAQLNLFYNTNDVILNKDTGCGIGFKFNYSQTIKDVLIGDVTYTEYIDADGTHHYFNYINDVYVAQDDFDMILTKEGFEYTLKDKDNNQMKFFDVNFVATLYKIIDVEGNETIINHDSNNRITKVKDPNYSEINILYETNKITVSSSSETVVLNYVDNKLSSIERLSGVTNFIYNTNNLISKIIDETGRKYGYDYYDIKPYKIKKVTEYSINDTIGNFFLMEYDLNSTTITDNKNRKTINQFNYKGNLSTVSYLPFENDLNHVYSNKLEYDKQTNKILSEGYATGYVKNYLKNISFERDEQIFSKTDQIVMSYSSDYAYSGSRSLKVNNITNNEYIFKTINITKGNYYTFSSYFKNNNKLTLNLSYTSGNGDIVNVNETIPLNEDFSLYDVSIYYPNDATSDLVVKIISNEIGTYYIDNIQLEDGEVSNECNLFENSDFEDNLNDWVLNAYNADDYNDKVPVNDNINLITLENNSKAMKINMNYNHTTNESKKIYMSGKAGDVYQISFMYKNNGFDIYSDNDFNHAYVIFNYLNIGLENNKFDLFSIKRSSDWQYFSFTVSAVDGYNSFNIYINQTRNANDFYIKNLCIFKDIRNRAYNYDENGNIISISNLNNKSNNFDYDKNNQLIQMIDTKGKNFEFEYDNILTNRVLNGISSTGISNQIKYDSYGNPIVTRILKNNNQEITDGLYKIRLKGTDKYLRNIESSVKISNEDCNHDLWHLEKADEFYKIKHSITNKYITIVENNIFITPYQGDNSLFKLTKNKNGSYLIKLKSVDKYFKFNGDLLEIATLVENDYHFEFYFETTNKLFMENSATYTEDGKFIKSTTDELLRKTIYDIDTNTGLTNSVTNPRGQTTYYTYNDKKQMNSVINGDKQVNYSYTSNNLLDKINQNNKEYKFIYDEFLNTKQIKINDTTLVTNNYEEGNGNLLSSIYGNNDVISFNYDEFNRINKVIKEDNIYNYKYDNNGNLVKIISNNDITRFDYDLAKRLNQYKYNDFIVNYEYDNGDNIIKRIYKLNNITNNVTNTLNDDDAITKSMFNSSEVNYNYDQLGRIESRNINNSFNTNYKYVTNGSRTSTLVKSIENNNEIYSYRYDKLNNITHIYHNNTLENRYYYDEYNELIKENNYLLNETIRYKYDESGNILSKKVYKLDTYDLKACNKYEYTNLNWEDQLTKFNDDTITYDEIGNPLTIGNNTLTWINGRQLHTFSNLNNNITYKYNDNSIRTSKTVNNVETKYYLEGNKILFEQTDNNVLYYIRNAVDDLIGFKYNNDIYYYVKNTQDDIIGILDSNHNLIAKYTYDSWGNILSITDSNNINISSNQSHIANINPFRYRSYYYDSETKLYYLNSRYYNPLWGRFLNADAGIASTGSINGYNMYQYAFNNPINLDDSDGNWPKISKWLKKNLKKIAIGVAAIAIGVAVTAAVVAIGGGAAVAFAAAKAAAVVGIKAAVSTAIVSAGIKAVATATISTFSGDSIETQITKTAAAAVDGFSSGFMAGGIMAGASQVASAGFQCAANLGVQTGRKGGKYITSNIKIFSPNNKKFRETGGTILKIGESFRLDVGFNTLLHIHGKIKDTVFDHVPVGDAISSIIGIFNN